MVERKSNFSNIPIWRCDIEGSRLERYDSRQVAGQWVKDNCETSASVTNIVHFINSHINGVKKSAYGFKWQLDHDDLPGEIWKEVHDIHVNGRTNVSVSSEGRVKHGNIITKGGPNQKGYYACGIGDKIYKVHRLVALTFLPNFYGRPEINHKNGDKSDNRIYNLEWCTASYNQLHSYRFKLNKSAKKVHQLDMDGNFIKEFDSIRGASKELGLHEDSISKCARGKTKKTGGFKWKYA